MSPLAGLRALLRDPVLRLVAAALICTGSVGAALAPYQSLIALRLFGYTPRSYGVILVTAALVAVCSAIAAGILADQFARRRAVAVALICSMTLGPALVRLHPSPITFALAHALLMPLSAGLFGQLFALARIVTANRPPAERERIAALIRAAFSLPFVTILPLWSLAVEAGVPILDVYALALIAALAAFALILRGWPADASLPENRRSGLRFAEGLRELTHPAVLLRMAALGLTGASIGLYLTLLGPILTTFGGHPSGIVALFARLVAGMEVPSMMIGASLVARWPKTRVIGLGALIHAGFMVSLAVLARAPHPLWLVIPAGLGAGLLLTVPLGYIQDLLGHRPGAGGALIAVNQFLTGASAALAFMLGTEIAGYPGAAVCGALFALSGAALLCLLDRGAARALP